MPFRQTSRHLRRTILSLVLWALTLAQTLGAIHRVVHAPLAVQAAAAQAVAVKAPSGTAIAVAQSPTTWLQALFYGHSAEHRCDLYDQSSHADVLVDAVAHDDPSPSTCAVDVDADVGRHAARALVSRARGPPPAS